MVVTVKFGEQLDSRASMDIHLGELSDSAILYRHFNQNALVPRRDIATPPSCVYNPGGLYLLTWPRGTEQDFAAKVLRLQHKTQPGWYVYRIILIDAE